MRLNLFSNWANGASGVMWWCANDFTKMTTAPYTWAMCEIELGMMDSERKPKPVLEETKRIAEVIEGFDFDLPKAEEDVVCILTQEQKQWGVGYMSYCMTKQAGLNAHFAFCKDKIPKSDCYIIPSVHGFNVMPRENYLEIKSRVKKISTVKPFVYSEGNGTEENPYLISDEKQLDYIRYFQNKHCTLPE